MGAVYVISLGALSRVCSLYAQLVQTLGHGGSVRDQLGSTDSWGSVCDQLAGH